MVQIRPIKNGLKKAQPAAVPVLVIIVAFITFVLWKNNGNQTSLPQSESVVQTDQVANEKSNPEKASPASNPAEIDAPTKSAILAQLKKAAIAAQGAKPVKGEVSQRPVFVSKVEWDVLHEAMAQNPDYNLNELVNKLLFFKKYEVWKSLRTPDADVAARHALAKEILAMIPVHIKTLGPKQAEAMIHEMKSDLSGKKS